MTFEDWMRRRGLSEASIRSYSSAMQRVMSRWAMEHQLADKPLMEFKSAAEFNGIAGKLKLLSVFQERNKSGNHMYSSALVQFADFLADGHSGDVAEDIDEILTNPGLSATEKMNQVKARIGQGVFRKRVLSHWKACAVTGFKSTNLLVASHIKPWRQSNSEERLHKFNGLMLIPNLDKAFDAGLITFLRSGPIALSPRLSEPEKLGISADMRVNLYAQHQPFMEFHRDVVFRAN